MKPEDIGTPFQPAEAERIREIAAGWLARLDRGLDDAEATAMMEWLAADPAHTDAFERQRRNWKRLDTLVEWCPEHAGVPNPDLLAPGQPQHRPWVRWLTLAGLGMAAVITLVWWVADRHPSSDPNESAFVANVEGEPAPQTLPDGSVLFLKGVSEVALEFSDHERRVRLDTGEVYFRVAKDPGRPFVVIARGLRLEAVGTAFNVRIANASLELLVEEGKVALESTLPSADTEFAESASRREHRLLGARQRAIVQLNPRQGALQPQIDSLSANELKRVIAWQHRKLRFHNQALGEILKEFNRLNDVQMVLEDERLAGIEISGTMHSGNIEGFTRLLDAGFGIQSQATDEYTIMLFDPLAKNT